MKIFANVILTIGVCLAAVGAAGFHNPAETVGGEETGRTTEEQAWPMFIAGMVAVAIGGFVQRSGRSAVAQAEHEDQTRDTVTGLVTRIRATVVEIDERRNELSREEVCTRIDDLMKGDFFDLIDKREDIERQLGFTNYAKFWDGIAVCERLLWRTWSIGTDGYKEEAIAELPRARENIDHAVKELATLWPAKTA